MSALGHKPTYYHTEAAMLNDPDEWDASAEHSGAKERVLRVLRHREGVLSKIVALGLIHSSQCSVCFGRKLNTVNRRRYFAFRYV
jgi:hypothetical protein